MDVYFLIFASVGLFAALVCFVVIVFGYYRRRQRTHYWEKEQLKSAFRQELLESQLEMQEQTFDRISQEIHDNVGQVLILAKVQANYIKETGKIDLIEDVKENIGKALNDLRDIAKSLSGERIGSLTLEEAIKMEVERINKGGIIHARVLSDGKEHAFDVQKKQILFRLLQECLQNVLKHSNATEMDLMFYLGGPEKAIIVKDNGQGFDTRKVMQEGSGLGFQNMKTRTSLIGCDLVIESDIGKGTLVKIILRN